jgi:hypothetical protein
MLGFGLHVACVVGSRNATTEFGNLAIASWQLSTTTTFEATRANRETCRLQVLALCSTDSSIESFVSKSVLHSWTVTPPRSMCAG